MRKLISMVLAVMMIVTNLGGVVFADGSAADYVSITIDQTPTGLSLTDTGKSVSVQGVKEDGTKETITEGVTYTVEKIGDTASVEVAGNGAITPKAKGLAVIKAAYGTHSDSILVTVGGSVVFNENFDQVDETKHVTKAYQGAVKNDIAKAAGWIGTAVQSTTEKHTGSGSLDVISLTESSDFSGLEKEDGTTGAGWDNFKNVWDVRLPLVTTNDEWKKAVSDMSAVIEFWVKPRGKFLGYDTRGGFCHKSNAINISMSGGTSPCKGSLRSSADGYWSWLEEQNTGTIVNDKIPFKNEWTQIIIDASHGDGTVNLYIDGQLFRTHKCAEGCTCTTNRAFNEFQITRDPNANAENGAYVDDIRCYDFSAPMKSISLENSQTGFALSDKNVKMVVTGTDKDGAAKTISNSSVKFEVTKLGEYDSITIAADGTVTPVTGGVSLVKATYTDGTNGDLSASIIVTVGAKALSNSFDTEESVKFPITWPRGISNADALKNATGTTKLDTDMKHSGTGSMYAKAYYGTSLDTYSDIVKTDESDVTSTDVSAMRDSRWMRIKLTGDDALPEHGVVELWFKDELGNNGGDTGFYIEGSYNDSTYRAINGFVRVTGGKYYWNNDSKNKNFESYTVTHTNSWHQLIINYSDEHNAYVYIDGQLLYKNKEDSSIVNSLGKIEFQRAVNQNDKNSSWIDNLVIYNTASTSLDPEGIAVKMEGTSLKGSYTFKNNSANTSITESESVYKYIRYDSKDAAEGTTVKTGTCTDKSVPAYELTTDDVGKFFAFEVTPKGGGMTGNTGITSKIQGPAAPTASEVKISGRLVAGEKVTGTYKYADINGDEEAGSTFRWLSSDTKDGTFTAIDGATSSELTIPANLDGKFIKFEVTPKNAGFGGSDGVAVLSDAVGVGNTPPAASDVKIKGGAYTGSVLEVTYTYSDEDDDKEGTTKFQWYVSDTENGTFTAISGATGSQLGVSDDLGGKYVLAEVTPVDAYGKAGKAVKSSAIFIKKVDTGDTTTVNALYVATDGNDANDGTIDKPFATLKGARDAIRVMKTANKYPATGVTVYIKGGTYVFTETLEFDENDSGEEYAPVTYRPYNNEKVTLTGGKVLDYSKFKAVDGDMKNYLIDETAQSKVKVANVKDFGIDPKDIADYVLNEKDNYRKEDGATSRKEILYRMSLEMDGTYMPLSRYPNSPYKSKWLSTKQNSETSITCTDSHLNKWTYSATNGFYARAYWNAEWTCEYAKIGGLDTATGTMTVTATPNYWKTGYSKNAQYVGVYEEIDEPGEWYYDKNTGNLYIYPVDGANDESQITMSFLEESIISLNKTSYVTFYGIDITGGKGLYGVEVSNGTGNVFDGCNFHNFTVKAILIDGVDSRNNVIKNGEIYNCGGGGIRLRGGNSATLEKSNDTVTNNKIHDFSVIREGYGAAVDFSHNGDQGDMDGYVEGCGNIVSYNDIYNSPHMAIWLRAPYQTVEYNAFHDVCYNAQDMGCIYSGCQMYDLGHVIRYNHFYNIGVAQGGGSYYPCCYFSDDGSMGGEVYGNTFGPGIANCEAVKVHGGTGFKIYNNVIIDAKKVFRSQSWGASRWFDYFRKDDGGSYYSDRIANSMAFIAEHKDVYVKAFPWFEKYVTAYINKTTCTWDVNEFYDNVTINVNETLNSSYVYGGNCTPVNNANFKNTPEYVKDFESGNYSVSDLGYSKIREKIEDFPHLPYEAIGPGTVVNKLPVVTTISVTRGSGKVLNGSYIYSDSEKDHEGASVIKWYVASEDSDSAYTVINGQNKIDFTYDDSYAGKYIKMEVTPVDIYGRSGTAVRSSAVLIASGSEGFASQITAAKEKLSKATAGSNLGDYPQSAIDALKAAIEAAEKADTSSDTALNAAVSALNNAVNTFDNARITSITYTKESGEISVPSDLSEMDVTLENVGGEIIFKGTVLPKGKITAVINGKTITVTISEPVTLPNGQFKITKLDTTNAAEAGDVSLAFVLGAAGETYSPALNVTVDGILGQNFSKVTDDGEFAEIEGLKVLDQKHTFDLSSGAEFVAYGATVISKDATLATLAVNGSEITLAAGTTEYQFRLPEGVTTAVITATATNKNATVTIPEVTKLPARNLEIVVTAQSGAKMVYKLTILPTVTSSKDDDSNSGNNSGNSSGSGSVSSGNSNPAYKDNSYTTSTTGGGIASAGTSSNTSSVTSTGKFKDTVGHWAESDINDMANRGIVSGVTSDTFEPDRNITRAEFAALIVRALKLEADAESALTFKDVSADAWYADDVKAAADAELIQGYNGEFRPEDNITREEMAVVIMKAYAKLGKDAVSGDLKFDDADTISDWAVDSVKEAVATGLMSGMSENEFAPKDNATRAQVASLIKRLLDK